MNYLLLFSTLTWVALGLTSAAPGVVGGDSPELTAAAFHLGSAHAPGYPLFITLGHLFQFLPLGTPAFRLTFLSIVAQALAFLLLTGTLMDFLKYSNSYPSEPSPLSGRGGTGRRLRVQDFSLSILTAALVFAGPLFFHQLVSPEVFSLHLLFVSFFLRLVLFPSPGNFLVSSFAAGVSLSHQHLTFLILPALVWAYRGYLKIPKNLISSLSLILVGLSPYLLLPLRAIHSPAVNWGNPSTFHQFLYHIARAQYGGNITHGSFMNGVWDIYLYFTNIIMESAGITLTLLAIGFWKGGKNHKAEYFLGCFCLFVLLPFLIRTPYEPEMNHVNEAFLPPALLWFSPLVLSGSHWIFNNSQKLKRVSLVVLFIFIIVLTVYSHHRNDASRNFSVEDVGLDILSQMPSHSVLYSEGDAITFPLAYLKLVKGLRPDADIFDRTGGLFPDLYHLLDYRRKADAPNATMFQAELEYEKAHSPPSIYYSETTNLLGRPLTQTGLLFRVTTAGNPFSFPDALIWSNFRPPRVSLNHDYFSRETGARFYLFKSPFELNVQGNIPQGLGDLQTAKSLAFDNSRLLINSGLIENDHNLLDQAFATFEKAAQLTPLNPVAWYDRGVVAAKMDRGPQAIAFLQKAVQLSPQYADAHFRLGYQYYKAAHFEEAVQEWETTRKIDPLYSSAYQNLGYFFMKAHPDYAGQMFRQYLLLTPGAPDKTAIEKWLSTQRR